MDISPGTRLGPYEITASIGAGGMGEVYRARDTRLERSVAIKVLPQRLSSNPTLRERFAREAKAISNLSHPHICALYDVGQANGADYLVMELLEGESLADRISRGPLPPEQVVRYGVQIAEALHAAHKRGIVHRDLKPGNIMLTKSGAKLLDFGLASVGAARSGAVSSPDAPTQAQKPLTEDGVVLGTFQYMAPEQLEGRPADGRTDIFALGAVLYEMATGRRAFEGKSRASLIASILEREPPPISSVTPAAPLALDRVIRTCMAKEPDERWQSAHDVATELRWIADTSSEMLAERGKRGVRKRVVWAAGGVAAGVVLGVLGARLALRGAPGTPAPAARFAIALPPSAPLYYTGNSSIAISPDGTRIVYRAKEGASGRLYLRNIGRLEVTPIAGTDDAYSPVFSADGRWLSFQAHDRLMKVALDGSPPVLLTANRGLGNAWSGNTIYYNRTFAGGVWAISDGGGEPHQVIKPDPQHGMRGIVWPDVLPDGKTLLATVWNNGTWDDAKITAFPLDGGAPRPLVQGTFARYVPSGHILFARGGELFAVPFDAAKLRITGAAVPIAGVAMGMDNGQAQYAVSKNGTLVLGPGGVIENKRTLVWIDRAGNVQPVVPTQRPYSFPSLSPDGRTVAVTLETATFDIWQLDIERDTVTRVSHGGDDSEARWTRDGRRVIWGSSRSGHVNLYWAAADNSGGEQRLTSADHDQHANSVSPDGSKLVMTETTPQRADISVLTFASRTVVPLVSTPFNERDADLSPDGNWMLYTSNQSGQDEIYLRPFPGPGGRWQVSTDGANGAAWTHNGREIIYRKDVRFYAVGVETSPQVRIGKPQLLFEKEILPNWDISPDDQHILAVIASAPVTSGEIDVVLNCFDELQRRAPAR